MLTQVQTAGNFKPFRPIPRPDSGHGNAGNNTGDVFFRPEPRDFARTEMSLYAGPQVLGPVTINNELVLETSGGRDIAVVLLETSADVEVSEISLFIDSSGERVFATHRECKGCRAFFGTGTTHVYGLDERAQEAIPGHFVEGNKLSVKITLKIGDPDLIQQIRGTLAIIARVAAGQGSA